MIAAAAANMSRSAIAARIVGFAPGEYRHNAGSSNLLDHSQRRGSKEIFFAKSSDGALRIGH